MTNTIILITALLGTPGTQPNMVVVMTEMTVTECVEMQRGLAKGMPNHMVMCADSADPALDSLNIIGM